MPPGRASPWMPFPAQSEWTARTLRAGEREISGAPSVPHMFRCVCLCVCCEKSRECAVRSTLRLCHGTPPFPTSPGDNCKIFTPALVKRLHLPVPRLLRLRTFAPGRAGKIAPRKRRASRFLGRGGGWSGSLGKHRGGIGDGRLRGSPTRLNFIHKFGFHSSSDFRPPPVG